jgi:hypothetical protein
MIKSINYAAMIIKSNVVFAASKLFEFLINSSKDHLHAAHRVFSYLAKTKDFFIVYTTQMTNQNIFMIVFDASYADNWPSRDTSVRGAGYEPSACQKSQVISPIVVVVDCRRVQSAVERNFECVKPLNEAITF